MLERSIMELKNSMPNQRRILKTARAGRLDAFLLAESPLGGLVRWVARIRTSVHYVGNDMLETVRASLRSLAPGKGLDFVVSAPADLPVAHPHR